uniref:Uncharacterized protein n=1 Tax=Anguilla anguilla TaxID=7936 RepID=A0A0E9WW29_ANGAN
MSFDPAMTALLNIFFRFDYFIKKNRNIFEKEINGFKCVGLDLLW